MNVFHKILLLTLTVTYSINCVAQQNNYSTDLVENDGLGELKMVFEPGLILENEKVRKTFQPSFVVTSKGTLLAFCQGRLKFGGDNDPKVILMNRSYDSGQTWEGAEVLSRPMNFFAISPFSSIINGKEQISFITCVGLKVTKKYYDYDFQKVFAETGIDIDKIGSEKASVLCRYYSDDDGKTWNKEFLTGDKTPLYKKDKGHTLVFLNTIGQVHKINEGINKGRLIVAAPMRLVPESDTLSNNFRDHVCSGSGIIYSDDQGVSWSLGGNIIDYLGNEASVVSLNKGNKLFMIRRLNKIEGYKKYLSDSIKIPQVNERIAHKSFDGGKTWSELFFVNISDIKCHGTLAKINDRLYFTIPVGRKDRSKKMKYWDEDRVRGAVYFSDDLGKSWQHKIIEEEYFSYSTIGKLDEKHRITFFSRGGHGRFGIGCRVFTDEWLETK
jgi:sialidase-1